MKNERELENYLVKKCEEYKFQCQKQPCRGKNKGMPDRLITTHNREVYVELKNPNKKGKLSHDQWVCHERLRREGYEVNVVDSVEEINFLLKKLKWQEIQNYNPDLPKKHKNNKEIIKWIRDNLKETKGASNIVTSYWLKCYAESELGYYISNRNMKQSLIDAGFHAHNIDNKNWDYYISRRCNLYEKIKKNLIRPV